MQAKEFGLYSGNRHPPKTSVKGSFVVKAPFLEINLPLVDGGKEELLSRDYGNGPSSFLCNMQGSYETSQVSARPSRNHFSNRRAM